jgi:hypothetical protein
MIQRTDFFGGIMNMVDDDMIHHYTKINTLELILKNKTIRFNRLDKVDDKEEGYPYGKYFLAKYLYASCWTDSADESTRQWRKYAENCRGVRITLPKAFFKKYVTVPPNFLFIYPPQISYSLIPQEKMHTDKYYIMPTFLKKEHFEKKVVSMGGTPETQ